MARRTTAVFLAAPALAVSLAAMTTGPASADTTSAPAEISTAVTSSAAVAAVPAADYTVTDVRTAPSDPTWAAAELAPTAAGADTLDPATVVLRQVDGTWQVVDLGTAQVGCGLVTPAVQGELALLC
jgi:hypothetical protein